mgnify:CR=1 FL=1
MAYSKNDIVQVTIEDIGVTGEGIGKIDGYTLFVKDTVCLLYTSPSPRDCS